MKYRKFGKTGLEVSEVIFGAGAVGGLLINADDDTRRAAIRIALDGGVNWIDTAASYGNGKSEEALGWLLSELPAARRPHVSTKTAFDRAAGDFAGQAEAAITASLKRLQADSVDLYQVHNRIAASPGDVPNALTPDDFLRKDGVADAMRSLVDRGLTRHIGFTCTGEADAMREVMRSGRFESAQVYYNLLNPSAGRDMPPNWSAYDQENIIGAAEEGGVAVMVIRVLAAGIIATDRRTGREGGVVLNGDVASDEARMRAVLPLLSPSLGQRSQVAVRYALRNPGVSGVVVGLAELEHLRLAIEAAAMGPLPAALLERLDALADSDFGLS
ncbi:MAG: aldo/keto reductase [Chloroflexi bacterium]|nr:aldo/keto reductase [Chloroflexota bacterium]